MKWNWQQVDWPHFSYEPAKIDESEKRLLLGAGLLFGAFKHLGDEDKRQLIVELISNEALKTSAIEGEYLDGDSLQSGLAAGNRKVSAAEQGIAEVMVDLYRGFEMSLSHALLFEWHKMLTNGRRDLNDTGRYRRHADPMQIVSGAIYASKVHF
jgi:Fic family protein